MRHSLVSTLMPENWYFCLNNEHAPPVSRDLMPIIAPHIELKSPTLRRKFQAVGKCLILADHNPRKARGYVKDIEEQD